MGSSVRAMLVLVLAVGGIALVPSVAPAQAPPRLLLGASDTDVVEGEAVKFHGRGIRTPSRSDVTLQRKVGDDWTFVKRVTLWNGTRYRFTTVPPVGRQRYRVRMTTRAGEYVAHSPWHRIIVHAAG